MKFSSKSMLVSQKIIRKENLEIPIVCFSDGVDVLQFYDNNGVAQGVSPGQQCSIECDVSVKGSLRLVTCKPVNSVN